MARLDDFGKSGTGAHWLHIEDVLDEELSIIEAEAKEGEFGTYVVFAATDSGGKLLTLMTGADAIVQALLKVMQQEAFPVDVCFGKKGKMFTFS